MAVCVWHHHWHHGNHFRTKPVGDTRSASNFLVPIRRPPIRRIRPHQQRLLSNTYFRLARFVELDRGRSRGKTHVWLARWGAIQCWGDNRFGQTDAPEGQFKAISAGKWYTCGLNAGAAIQCWGDNGSGQTNAPRGNS